MQSAGTEGRIERIRMAMYDSVGCYGRMDSDGDGRPDRVRLVETGGRTND